MSAPSPSTPLEAPWRAGLRAARGLIVPGLFLQAVALTVVLGYYWTEPVRSALNSLSVLHDRAGLLYAIVATGLCGGVLPFLYLRVFPGQFAPPSFKSGLYFTGFWAYKGIEVDWWYHVQARLIGPGTGVADVALKGFLDQFVYCPIWAVPATVVVYNFAAGGWQIAPLIADLRAPGWYRRQVLPSLIANLGVWVPVVCLVYALPLPLQLPLFNLVLFFYTLLMAHLIRHQSKTA